MFVYMDCDHPKPRHELLCTPARNADSVEFKDEHGKPKMYQVIFEHGRAEVPDNLGRWLVDNGMAVRSRIIKPAQHLIRSMIS